MLLPYAWISEAQHRIAPHCQHTPLTYDAANDLFIKWETVQVTGSFKARGALNKVLSLQPWELDAGLVAASAGNHGLGVALAAQIAGCPATIFVPEDAVPYKLEKIRALGARLRLISGGYAAAERAGKVNAAATGAIWVSPYNDGQIIAGQGTLALETLADLPELPPDSPWLVPVGGGGLLAGIGAVLRHHAQLNPIIGVQAENSPYFHALLAHRSQRSVHELPTLADGLAGAVEDRSLTIPLVRSFASQVVLVSEAEIAQAVIYSWEHYGETIEPSAAAALAAALTGKISQRPAVIIASGGNIQPELHARLCRSSALPYTYRL